MTKHDASPTMSSDRLAELLSSPITFATKVRKQLAERGVSAPTTPGTAVTPPPAVPVEHLTRWSVALNLLVEDVRFQLPNHGIEQRLRDILDDIRATRHHAGDPS